jgi:anti-sigma regulatory factor (Ser/Thr protein kinase)
MAPERGPKSSRGGPRRVVCRVSSDGDTYSVQQAALKLAVELRFPRRDAVEVAIVASELTSNILKYGVRGSVALDAVDDTRRGPGIRVTASDEGAPFADFERVLADGCDAAGKLQPSDYAGRRGIGSGLGAVQRFSDDLGWTTQPGGKQVWAVRYRRRP